MSCSEKKKKKNYRSGLYTEKNYGTGPYVEKYSRTGLCT